MPALSRTAVADISLADLPPSHETRWVMSRKAGLISLEDAATRYRLTLDELTEWQSYFARHGARGLRATFLQQYRHIRRP
jgi:hypothetical protein